MNNSLHQNRLYNITNNLEANDLYRPPPSFEVDDVVLSRTERQSDLEAAASGYGGDHYCPEGIPVETALFAILGAFGLAFGILFMAITLITMPPGRRKRRGAEAYKPNSNEAPITYSDMFSDVLWHGMLVVR